MPTLPETSSLSFRQNGAYEEDELLLRLVVVVFPGALLSAVNRVHGDFNLCGRAEAEQRGLVRYPGLQMPAYYYY
jgi:hypothetical protein